MNKIVFEKEDLKRFCNLNKITEGTEVVAFGNSEYAGLYGEIVKINYGEKKEGNCECVVEIVVDFSLSAEDRKQKYQHLNNKGVSNVIITEEDDIAFRLYTDCLEKLDGQIVCEWCLKPLKNVSETQYVSINWTWKNGRYVKDDKNLGDTNYPRCEYCDARIESERLYY